jgi:integrase
MPTIKQDNRGSWYLNYSVEGKQTRRFFGKNAQGKQLAELALADITQKIHHKRMGTVEEIPAEQFFIEYLDYSESNKAKRSYQRDLTIIKNFEPIFRGKNLSEIGAKEVEAYKRNRLKVVVKSTVNRELNTIKAAFGWAVELGYLKSNPIRPVKRFKEPKSLLRFFSLDEIKAIMVNIEDRSGPLSAMISVLLMTGMRRDELMHLEWTDINLKENWLYIQPKPDWTPKTYEARVIPLSKELKELLLRIPRDGNLVFNYCHAHSLSRSFKGILKRTGIGSGSLHTLRHTYASQMVMAGVDIATVQKLLGHSNIATTMRYAHLSPEHLQESAQKSRSYFNAIEKASKGDKGKVVNLVDV